LLWRGGMRKNLHAVALLASVIILVAACVDTGLGEELELDEEASAKSDGTPWYKVYSCNGGAGVLDVNGNERRNLQFVIRDPDIIKFFHDRGVVSVSYGATELVLSGWTGRVDFSRVYGPALSAQPYGSPGVFARADFKEMIANYNYYQGGRFARIFVDGPGIKVQFGVIEKRGCAITKTSCPGDGFPCTTACVEHYTEFVESANWYFNNCH
jgi:hypothetical protein